MTFPFNDSGTLFALALGFLFGFSLESGGLADSKKLISQFNFSDWRVLKAMFGAIAFAALGIAGLSYFGLIDEGSLFIPPAVLGSAAIGGGLVGAGFAMAGYCPGTSMAAAATGKSDAMVYLVGMLFGTYLYAIVFPFFEDLPNLGPVSGADTLDQALGVSPLVIATVIAILAAVAFRVGSKFEAAAAARSKDIDSSDHSIQELEKVRVAEKAKTLS